MRGDVCPEPSVRRVRGRDPQDPETTAPGSRGLRGCPPWWLSWTLGPLALWWPCGLGAPGRRRGRSAGWWGPDPQGGSNGSPRRLFLPRDGCGSGAGQEDTSPSQCPATPRAQPAGEPLRCLGCPTPFGPTADLWRRLVGPTGWRAEGGGAAPRRPVQPRSGMAADLHPRGRSHWVHPCP